MKHNTAFARALSIPIALAFVVGCRPGGGGDLPEITSEDTPDLGELIDPDGDATAVAAQIGDPATLLQLASDQGEQVRSDVANILNFLRDATAREPDVKGVDVVGHPFGRWTITDDATGLTVHVIALRITEDRVRIVVQGEKDALSLPLMTGVFVKKAPRVGGGRFHLSLTNMSDLTAPEGQGADGSIHFLFANHRSDIRGRRVLYLNVDERATPPGDAKSFAADLVRLPGVGGRFRSIYAADFIPQAEGLEALGLRAAWLAGIGGRTDVVIATQAGGGQVLGIASECWDPAGMRSAYADTDPNNDADEPNEGDVGDCFGLAEDPVDEEQVNAGDDDIDEELEEVLDDSGANDVDENEAEDATVPEPAEEGAEAP